MFVFALEFEQERDLQAALRRLEQLNVTGEFHIRPLEGGRSWRLTVYAERSLRDASIEKLGGRRVDGA